MHILKRLLAIVITVMSLVGIVLTLTGVIGVWLANPILTRNIIDIVDSVQEILVQVEETLKIVNVTMQNLEGPIKMISEAAGMIQNLIPGLAGVGDIINDFMEIKEMLITSEEQIGAAIGIMDTIEKLVPLAVTTASFLVTLLLLWVSFSQVGLLIHGISFFTGRDILARWRET